MKSATNSHWLMDRREKTAWLGGFSLVRWRRGWDSNPRWTCAHSGFRDRHVQPLRHLSKARILPARLGGGDDSAGLSHVRRQGSRNVDPAVGPLIVLHHRNEGASNRKS